MKLKMSWVESKSQYDKLLYLYERTKQGYDKLSQYPDPEIEIKRIEMDLEEKDEDSRRKLRILYKRKIELAKSLDFSKKLLQNALTNLTILRKRLRPCKIKEDDWRSRDNDKIKIINMEYKYDSIENAFEIIKDNSLKYGDSIIYLDMFLTVASENTCYYSDVILNIGIAKVCIIQDVFPINPLFWSSEGRIIIRPKYEMEYLQYYLLESFEDVKYVETLPYQYIYSTIICGKRCIIYTDKEINMYTSLIPIGIHEMDSSIRLIAYSEDTLDKRRLRQEHLGNDIIYPVINELSDTDEDTNYNDSDTESQSSSIEDRRINEESDNEESDNEESDNEESDNEESDNEESDNEESDNGSQRDFSESDSDSENMDD